MRAGATSSVHPQPRTWQLHPPGRRPKPSFPSSSHTSASDLRLQIHSISRIRPLLIAATGPATAISHLDCCSGLCTVSLFLSLSVQWPKGSCYNLRSCRFSAQNLCPLWPPRPCVICPHDTSLTSSPSIFPLALSISATLASLLILRCARRIPAPGPLHGLLLPPRTSSPQRAERLIPPLLYHLPQMLPSRGGLA